MTQDVTSGNTEPSRLFARNATGLTREVSWVDAMIYNLLWSSIPLSLAFLLLFGPFYPESSPYGAIIAAFVLTIPVALLYAMFSSAIPRSGGDYTWISRSLSPTTGFVSNLSFTFWTTFFIGVYSVFLSYYGLAPLLRSAASFFGSSSLLDAANWTTTTSGTILFGSLTVLAAAALLTFGQGLRGFMKFQKYAFALWMLGAVLLPIVIITVVSQDAFIERFDLYVTGLGGAPDAYATLLESSPIEATSPRFGSTVLMATLPFYTLGFIFQSAYFSGEIKRAKKSAARSIVGAEIIAVVLLLAGVFAFQSRISDFLYVAGTADFTAVGLDFPPLYTEMAAIAVGNTAVGLLIGVAMIMVFIAWIPQTMILISRSMFAWSFDGLAPERISRVNPRTHSPVNAVAVITVLSLISVTVIGFRPELTFVVGLLGLTLTYVLVSVAGIVFPYRQPDTFASSPFNMRLGGVPVMSLVAGVSLVGMLCMVSVLLLDENSGTSWALDRSRVYLSLAILMVGVVLFQVIRAVRRARGFDIDLAYKEIPPE
jgi:basic amino acid/polyamine antiporter, APA family